MTARPQISRALTIASIGAMFSLTVPIGAQSAMPNASAVRRLDSLFASFDSATTPGCAVGVSRGASTPVYRSYGSANLEQVLPLDTNTVFEAGSVSKQITAAAILLLSKEGRLSLGDPARKWLPELWSGLTPFTVGDLMHHVTGLRDYGNLLELSGWPRGTRVYDAEDVLRLMARQRALNFTPREEYLYSNTGFVLASIIVARASGTSFSAYTQRAIFAPLGMTHTSWRDDYTRIVPHRAQGYTPNDSGRWTLDMPFENTVGHAGLLTTVTDLMRWQARFARQPEIAARASGGTIGDASFAADMEAPFTLRTGRLSPYALGLELDTLDGEQTVSHAGWTSGYKAYVGRVPARDVAVAVLCNAGSLNTEDLGPVVLAIAADLQLPGNSEPPSFGASADAADQRSLSRFSGMYRSTRTRQPVMVRAFADGITINTWTGYRRVDDSTFMSLTGARQLQFRFDGRGTPREYQLRIANDSVRFRRVAPWTPNKQTRASLVGSYRCSEADADVELIDTERGLALRLRGRRVSRLEPRYRDAFDVVGDSWLITVSRDREGQVRGIDFGTMRTRTVPCARRNASFVVDRPVSGSRARPAPR